MSDRTDTSSRSIQVVLYGRANKRGALAVARRVGKILGLSVRPDVLELPIPIEARKPRGWNGHDAQFLLQQMVLLSTHMGDVIALAFTDENIVPREDFNFIFGWGWHRAAVVSFNRMGTGPRQASRAAKITLHELGHAIGIKITDGTSRDGHHHTYESGVECIMVGDMEKDSVDTIDATPLAFCASCAAQAARLTAR